MRRQSKRACIGVGAKAFTLIETLIVLAIVALISGALIPVVTRPYVAERQVEAMYEMAAIQTAISGKPEEGQFGFIGDVSALGGSTDPLTTLVASNLSTNPGLNALMEAGTITLATSGDAAASAPGVIMGWNGPYLRPRFPGALIDPWGTAYRIERSTTDDTRWRLRCDGPDRTQGTADDIIFPSGATDAYFESQGQVTVELMKTNNFGQWPFTATEAATYTVSMSPNNASPSIDCVQVAGTNRFTCTKTWFGQHQVFVYQGAPPAVAGKKIALMSPQLVTQINVDREGTATDPVTPCDKTPATWLTDTNYSAALQVTLIAEGAFCATKPTVQRSQNMVVTLSGLVTPSSDTTECEVSVKMTSDTNAGPWTLAGPIKIKGTTTAVPFTLSGNGVAPINAVAPGGALTVYARVVATGGTCTATPPTDPVNATAGSLVMLGHP